MNKKLRNLLISAAVLPGMTLSVGALAATANARPIPTAKRTICICRPLPFRQLRSRRMHKRQFDRHLTAEQVRTIVSARLIMRGNKYLKVGNITKATHNGDNNFYRAAIITTEHGDLVRNILVNGHTGRAHRI